MLFLSNQPIHFCIQMYRASFNKNKSEHLFYSIIIILTFTPSFIFEFQDAFMRRVNHEI